MTNTPVDETEARLLKEKLFLLEKERSLKVGLPHLHGWPWYTWAWDFFQSRNRFNFLCAANQISKSSTQIRKCIDWATEPSKWPLLWHTKPTQFWYLYPSKPVATEEFETKWKEFLPGPEYKDHPQYGWKETKKNHEIYCITFNTGVIVYFKAYEQDVKNLQTGTVYAVFCDEELPETHFHELRTRLTSTNGYFHMVFTATIGQDTWRRTMEPTNETEELFKKAWKKQVSLYECLVYKDGTKSHWNHERIKEIEMDCATDAEIQKRVFGKFVVAGGLKCSGFSRVRNLVPNQKIPFDWHIYSGVDIGSGGPTGHPAAIAFVAVRPDFKFGIVFRGWRGDGIVTASGDILQKHNELCVSEVPEGDSATTQVSFNPVLKSYDWQAKDFFIVSSRAGAGFTQADKRRDAGIGMLNTLFKLGMLTIMEGDPELNKLVIEITSLKEGMSKIHAKDDFYDALRYAIMPIPWNFEGVAGEIFKLEEKNDDPRSEAQKAYDERRSGNLPEPKDEGRSLEAEFEEWQGLIDGAS